MARLLVGLPTLVGDIEKYAKRFDMVELRPLDMSIPRASTLRSWRKSAPPGFVFSVVLPRLVGELGAGKETDAALSTALEVATHVEARCLVLATPAGVRPTAQNKRRLAAMVERLPREGVVVCWEPAGIWEVEEVQAVARSMGALPVLDAARETLPAGPIAYTRLRGLGKATTIGARALERVAERLRGRREVFVVVDGSGEAARVKAGLAVALSRQKGAPAGPLVVRPGSSALQAEDEEQ